MNIILLGPQGAGKGTQATLLSEKLGLVHLEMGKILRNIARSDSEHAPMVRETMRSGKLVSDELVRLISRDFVTKHHPNTNGFIFEGYPRSVMQYDHLKDTLAQYGKQMDAVINLEISEAETIKRLSTRLTCVDCGEIYNTASHPSKTADICDACGGILVQRDDDQPEAIHRRLAIYRENTHKVFLKACDEGIGHEINGEQPIATVFTDILDYLQTLSSYAEQDFVSLT